MAISDAVNQWFTANPNATPQQVADAVKSVGGLEANAGLSDILANRYGTDVGTITSNYNQLTAPAAAPLASAPSTVDQLYTSVLGRQGEAAGLDYWKQQFGDSVDANELATFKNAAQAELANRSPAEQAQLAPNYFTAAPSATAPAATSSPLQNNVNAWFAANPDATQQDVVSAVQSIGGLTPELASVLASKYGTDVNTIQSTYNNAIQDRQYTDLVTNAYGDIGRTGVGTAASNIDQAGLDYWKGQLAAGAIAPDQFNSVFGNAVRQYKTEHPDDPYTQYVNNYQLGQQTDAMKTELEGALSDKKITFDEAAAIKRYRDEYGFSPDDISKATGVPIESVNQVLDLSPVTWNAPELKPVELRGRNTWFNPNTGQKYIGKAAAEAANNQFLAPYKKETLANAWALAEKTGDYSNVSDLLKQTGVTGFDVNQMFGLNPQQQQALTQKTGFEFISPKITYHNGTQYDTKTLMKIAGQLGETLDLSQLSGGAFGETRANIGYDPDEFERATGLKATPLNQVLLDAATGLVNQGITDLSQIKQGDVKSEVGVRRVYDEATGGYLDKYVASWGDPDSNTFQTRELTPEEVARITRTVNDTGEGGTQEVMTLKDVVTGKKLMYGDKALPTDGSYIGAGGTYTGPGYTGYGVNFDESGKPTFRTYGKSTSDLDWAQPIITAGSIIPNPYQPYFQAANAAIQLDQGNTTGAIISGLGSYAGFQGADAAATTELGGLNSTSGLDIGSGMSPAVQATQNAQYARLGAAGIAAGQAADNGNYAPLIALTANVAGINKMPEVAFAANTLSAANAIATNNPAALMSAAGNLTNSPNLKLAGSATNFVNAYNSGNQAAIAAAGVALNASINANAPSAASTLKTTIFGPTRIDTSSLPQGSPINPSGPSTDASGAGPLSGINTASADGSIPQIEVGGAPIFAGTANAARVSVPVGYRLMTMDEADARPAGSYYDITQNAWIAPDEEGMTELRNLQGALSGPAPDGYGRDVTNLDSSAVTGGLSGATSTGGAPSSNIGEIVVTADRPTSEIPEIVVTADRPVVNDAGEIVITADRPVTETPVVTPPAVTPPTATSPSTPISPTPTKITQASSPLSAAAQAIPKLDSSPQGLTSTVQRDKKILKELKMLFGTLTPELVSALEDRGIRVPQVEEAKDDNKDDEEQPTEKQLAEDKNLETKFAAAGGEITSKIDQKINYVQPGLFAAAPVLEQQSRVGALKHLHEGLVPRRATVGMTKGGLPSKYAEATPKGHNPEFITGLTGYYASGEGTGQSDDIDALLHDGDYVADADLVAALGDGSSKAGAEALEKFRRSIPHNSHAEGGQPVAAKIADGEYVFPASFVTAIGKGDNKAGAAVLDKMREAIRAHKRSAPTSKIPPKAKSPLDYLKMVKG